MTALMEVAAADGILSEAERRWIIGFANATGAPQVVLDQLQNYQAKGMDELLKVFHIESGHAHGKYALLSLIYDGFRAAGADEELHPKEVEAIYALGKTLGADVEQIKKLYELYMEEVQLRRKRLAVIFPHGTNNVVGEIEKAY
ncbi:unnamed protein product [Rotaria sp. Silwood1]|nr:unnamed protein product [Rotaria sp. Silwood1]CAF3935810.1 unnamed protein product [Rotaria sp. Silwood1]